MFLCFPTSRALLAAVSNCALLALLASCGDTTSTVGQLKAARTVDAPEGSSGSSGSTPSSPSDGAGGSKSGDAGKASSASDDAGTIVGTPDAGPPLTSPFAECAGPVTYADRRELALYFMVDNNLTFPNAGAWQNLQQGLRRYIADPRAAGTGLGIDYFGLDCNVENYAEPEVRIATLPDNARAVIESFAVLPINASPMYPAVVGAIAYAREQAIADATLKLVVVLITDGISDLNCNSNIENLTQATRDGAQGSPSIPTYIVAVDSSMGSVDVFNRGARFDPLEDMAMAAGTESVRGVDVQAEPTILSGNIAPSPTADALVAIQREAEPCDYAVPADVPEDAKGVWLTRNDVSNDAGWMRLALVDSVADCDGINSYYFATEREVRWARLCDATCTDVKDKRPMLAWVMGCQ